MKILFVRNKLPLSRMICDLTKENASHTAIEFSAGFVIHANLKGVHLEGAKNFRKNNEVTYELSPENPSQLENPEKLNSLLEKYEFSLYDFGGLLFIGFCFMLRAWFRIPLPKQNLWQASGMFLCTEWVQTYIDEEVDSMITPYKLYKKLLDTKKWC